MSPVFGHGRLRLYLLKLLEESPRHGYEVIRLLQDRFLGVYSPPPERSTRGSPGWSRRAWSATRWSRARRCTR
ncbi:hypothetical protein ACFQHO_31750 [Actinomadura yumaensis]|uniref:hypothetical protein n=1 Tax=Actinomadura yumaensis TaxID=111807 RepID=UPI003611F923